MSAKSLYRKIGIISLGILFTLAAAGLALFTWWSHQGEPRYQGSFILEKLHHEVTVDFDYSGIPHIKADNEEDLYRSLGYTMAQDRLFQMDLLRRVVHGEVAEVFGAKALPVDLLFRSLGLIHGMKDRIVTGEIDPHLYSLMQAYYDGVNQYIDGGNWSYEYKLLGLTPKKFEVVDGFGILGYMAYSFAQSFKVDLLLDKVSKEKGDEFANSLRASPHKKKAKKVGIFSDRSSGPGSPQVWAQAHRWLEENLGMFTGSNAWALAPDKTNSGGAILASDPHVQFAIPGIWYEAVVDWGEGPFSGLFVPGVPFAAMGHKKQLGWGVTISYIDDMDFYRETLSDDGSKLFYKGHWQPLEKRHEVIKVKGEKDHEVDLYWGVHGPILDKVQPLMQGKLAMKWGHFNGENRAALAFYKMMKSSDQVEFEHALAWAKSPGLNIVYADARGHIARYLVGSIPIRPEHMDGDLIYEGESGLYDWQGDLAFEKRPHIKDPATHLIVSANQKPEQGNYPGYYQPSDRYDTIKSLLQAKEKWTLEEMQYLQTSATDIYTFALRDQIIRSFDYQKLDERLKPALTTLKQWDGRYNKDSVAASLMQETLRLSGQALLDPVKEYYLQYCDTNFFVEHVKKRILRNNPYQLLASSFEKALSHLDKQFGSWRQANWGKLHTLTIEHPLGKGGPLLAKIFNLGPFAVDGARDTINNLRRVGCRAGFQVKAGPSSRRLIDFSHPQDSLAVLPLGNSAHWKSPFFKNQWPLYSKGKYRKAFLKGQLHQGERFGRLVFKRAKK